MALIKKFTISQGCKVFTYSLITIPTYTVTTEPVVSASYIQTSAETDAKKAQAAQQAAQGS